MAHYDAGNRHTWSEFCAIGLAVLWHDVKESIAESWREAGAGTYGDNCTHPESGITSDFWRMTYTCQRCGKIRGEEPDGPWWTPEEWQMPKRYEPEQLPDGRVRYHIVIDKGSQQ